MNNITDHYLSLQTRLDYLDYAESNSCSVSDNSYIMHLREMEIKEVELLHDESEMEEV